MSEEIRTEEKARQEQAERAHVIVLKKPHTWERKEFTEIDLGGLDKLTIRDAIDAQRDLFGQQEVASSLLCETTTAFAMEIAAKASGLPIEFFKMLPINVGRQVKRAVQEHIISVERAGTWTKKVRDVQYMSMSWRKNDGARAKKIQAEERASVEGWLVSMVKDAIRQIKAGK